MSIANEQLNPVEANSSCSGSTIPGFGIPRILNGSEYSGSTVHIYMNVEPPIHRAASKVYFHSNLKTLNFNNFDAVSVATVRFPQQQSC